MIPRYRTTGRKKQSRFVNQSTIFDEQFPSIVVEPIKLSIDKEVKSNEPIKKETKEIVPLDIFKEKELEKSQEKPLEKPQEKPLEKPEIIVKIPEGKHYTLTELAIPNKQKEFQTVHIESLDNKLPVPLVTTIEKISTSKWFTKDESMFLDHLLKALKDEKYVEKKIEQTPQEPKKEPKQEPNIKQYLEGLTQLISSQIIKHQPSETEELFVPYFNSPYLSVQGDITNVNEKISNIKATLLFSNNDSIILYPFGDKVTSYKIASPIDFKIYDEKGNQIGMAKGNQISTNPVKLRMDNINISEEQLKKLLPLTFEYICSEVMQ